MARPSSAPVRATVMVTRAATLATAVKRCTALQPQVNAGGVPGERRAPLGTSRDGLEEVERLVERASQCLDNFWEPLGQASRWDRELGPNRGLPPVESRRHEP